MKISKKPMFQPRTALMIAVAFILSAAIFSSATKKQAVAQEVLQKIEALVNDEIISGYDLNQRLGLIIAASGGERTPEEILQLSEQVLRSMVDERLQLQEAAEFEVEVEEQQIFEAFTNIAGNFQQTPEQFEQFLLEAGTNKKTLEDQLRAEFAWQAIVKGRLASQITISDEQVDERIERIISNTGKYEYRIAEIYLIVDNPSRRTLVRETADRLYEQLSRGAQFYIIAQQFSETSSASSGGDMGWVSEDQLSKEIKDVISQMDVGIVSIPIFSGSGYYILNLLHSLFYPFTEENDQATTEAWIENAETITATLNSCDGIPAIAEQLGITEYGEVAALPLRQLNPRLKPLIVDLETGKSSRPVVSEDGIRYSVVCDKVVPEVVQPTFNQVFGQLEQERLALMARRYLRDLRRDAIVDYK